MGMATKLGHINICRKEEKRKEIRKRIRKREKMET